MRKLITLLLLVVISVGVWGQQESFEKIQILKPGGGGTDPTYIFREDAINDRTKLRIQMGDENTSDFEIGYRFYGDANWYTNFSISGSGIGYLKNKMGIGITNPLTSLHVQKGSLINWTPSSGTTAIFESTESSRSFVNISARNESELWFGNGVTQNLGRIRYENNNNVMEFWVGAAERMKIDDAGNVGIGTSSPNTKLHVKSSGENLSILKLENTAWKCNQELAIEFWNGTGYKNVATSRIISKMNSCSNGGENLLFQTQSPIESGVNQTTPSTKLFIEATGDIGIGTTTPDAKLDVAGTIKAQEIEVTLVSSKDMQLNGTLAANNITYTTNGQTADHVFESDYKLRELSEVEAFIMENKHLPDIPSASEMEEQGVNLAEMNKLLLQKVEELTLYVIEKDKEVMGLEERLAKLEKLSIK